MLALRPSYFTQNLLLQVPALCATGALPYPYLPEHDMPFVRANDSAAAATPYLVDPTLDGAISQLLLQDMVLTALEALCCTAMQ